MRFFTVITLGLLLWKVFPSAQTAAGQPAQSDAQRTFRQLDRDRDGRLASEEFASDHARLFTRLLRTADSNGDGRLSESEFLEGLQAKRAAKPLVKKRQSRLPGADELLLLVAMMDANADGVIRLNEVPERLLPFYLRLEERIGRADQRQIRAREIARAAPRLTQFALVIVERLKLDVDLEIALLPEKSWALFKRLDRPRLHGDMLANVERALEMFRLLDANGDGQLVYEEIPEQYAARFDRLLARGDRNRDQRLSEREMQALSRRLRAAASQRTPKQAN